MNWFKDTYQIPDSRNWSVNNQFPVLSDGINLRNEIRGILYGTPGKKPLGHWVVLRHFTSELSEYFNKFSQESLGGPKFKYVDTLLRTRKVPTPLSATDDLNKIGTVLSDTFIYYFEYIVSVAMGDHIYELDITDHTTRPTTYNFIDKYDISRVHDYRLTDGNVQYFAALVKINAVKP